MYLILGFSPGIPRLSAVVKSSAEIYSCDMVKGRHNYTLVSYLNSICPKAKDGVIPTEVT